VIGIIGGAVTAAARTTGHYISFAITGAMMIGLCGYVGMHSRTRWGTHWQKYGPLYISILASFFIMADLTRHVLEDLTWWPETMSNGWGAAEYGGNGCSEEVMACLTTVGWLFTIVFTYTGFTLLMVATLWNANICDKLADFRKQWQAIRNGRAS